MQVCHRCDVKLCVNPDHLFLGTRQENADDAVAKGRIRRGASSPNAKLTESQVREIRKLVAQGQSRKSVAMTFSISKPHVDCICRREAWAHVTA
jgi:hypothetical protein